MPLPGAAKKAYNPLHIYRSLLREASYLPPVCRAQIEPRIRARFRKHRNDQTPEKRLRHALHDFRNLRAANLGDRGRMYKVMLLTFGRTGWRRHELIADLFQQEQPANSAQLEDQIRETQAASSRGWLDAWNKEKILAFSKSQATRKFSKSPRPEMTGKGTNPKAAVPPISIWGKPLADKPARTKELNWWKRVINRILPPLPRGEWELLKQLAAGVAGSQWAVPARRSPATTATPSLEEAPDALPAADGGVEAWDWQKYLSGPARTVERPNSRRFRLASRPFPTPASSPFDGPAIGFHNYTPRFWRRLYREVWLLTATMEKKPGGQAQGWNITWGGAPLRPLQPTAASLEFFEGVESNGAAPRPFIKKQPVKAIHKARPQKDVAEHH